MSSLFSRLAAVAAISVAGALLVPATASATSQSPAVTVPLCQAVTVGGQQVTAITFPAGSAVANAYDAGQAIAIQGNNESTLLNTGGSTTVASGKLQATGAFDTDNHGNMVPLCMVIKSGDGETSAPQSAWRFCTDRDQGACTQKPGMAQGPNAKLSDDQQAEIAYLLGKTLGSGTVEFDVSSGGSTSPLTLTQGTKLGRALLQTQIWCISDGGPYSSAGYFSGLTLTAAEMTCAGPETLQTWRESTIADGTLTITPATSSGVTGALVELVVEQNFDGAVTLSATGGSLVACDAPNAPVTALSLAKGISQTVCVASSTQGTVTVTASSQYVTPSSTTWYWAGQGCQVFADYTPGSGKSLTPSAKVTFLDTASPDTPSASDQCGTEHDSYTIPKTPGVDYYSGETLLEPGTHPTGGASTVTITARAQQGYTLPEGTKAEWTFTFGTSPCTSTSTSTSTNPATDPPASTSTTTDSTATTALTVSGQSSSMAAGSAGDSTTSIAVKGESDQVTDLASTGVPQSMPWIALAGAALIGFGFALTRVRRSTRAH